MRRLVVWNLMTLDGFFEGKEKWDLAFHLVAWGEELERFSLEQAEEIGTLLFGRITFEGMAAHWQTTEGEIADFMNATEKVVVSKTLADVAWNNSRILSDKPMAEIAELKRQDGKDIFVFGSAELTGGLLKHGLVDEYRLCIVPVVLGAGNPLFRPADAMARMSLVRSRELSPNAAVLYLKPETVAAVSP
jgi:dihydrofolate reductase